MCTNKENIIWIKAYTRIYGFLMSLGFTKSKADSNLYYKVEDDEIMILLLYVDDMFFYSRGKSRQRMQEEYCLKIGDEIPWHDALLPRSQSMAVPRRDFPKTRKIYN